MEREVTEKRTELEQKSEEAREELISYIEDKAVNEEDSFEDGFIKSLAGDNTTVKVNLDWDGESEVYVRKSSIGPSHGLAYVDMFNLHDEIAKIMETAPEHIDGRKQNGSTVLSLTVDVISGNIISFSEYGTFKDSSVDEYTEMVHEEIVEKPTEYEADYSLEKIEKALRKGAEVWGSTVEVNSENIETMVRTLVVSHRFSETTRAIKVSTGENLISDSSKNPNIEYRSAFAELLGIKQDIQKIVDEYIEVEDPNSISFFTLYIDEDDEVEDYEIRNHKVNKKNVKEGIQKELIGDVPTHVEKAENIYEREDIVRQDIPTETPEAYSYITLYEKNMGPTILTEYLGENPIVKYDDEFVEFEATMVIEVSENVSNLYEAIAKSIEKNESRNIDKIVKGTNTVSVPSV